MKKVVLSLLMLSLLVVSRESLSAQELLDSDSESDESVITREPSSDSDQDSEDYSALLATTEIFHPVNMIVRAYEARMTHAVDLSNLLADYSRKLYTGKLSHENVKEYKKVLPVISKL